MGWAIRLSTKLEQERERERDHNGCKSCWSTCLSWVKYCRDTFNNWCSRQGLHMWAKQNRGEGLQQGLLYYTRGSLEQRYNTIHLGKQEDGTRNESKEWEVDGKEDEKKKRETMEWMKKTTRTREGILDHYRGPPLTWVLAPSISQGRCEDVGASRASMVSKCQKGKD